MCTYHVLLLADGDYDYTRLRESSQDDNLYVLKMLTAKEPIFVTHMRCYKNLLLYIANVKPVMVDAITTAFLLHHILFSAYSVKTLDHYCVLTWSCELMCSRIYLKVFTHLDNLT